MKKIICILLFIFIVISIAEVKSFKGSTSENIKALNSTVQACQVDMQEDSNIMCD